MRLILLLVCSFLTAQSCIGQSAEAVYKKGDSLYKAKDFKNAAIGYSAVIKSQGKDADISMYWRAASAWALANAVDSAFHMLSFIEKSDKVSQPDVKTMESDKALNLLHTDKRWKPLIDNILARAIANYNVEELIYGRKDGVALTLLHLSPNKNVRGKALIYVIAGNWISSYQAAERMIRPSYAALERGYSVFLVVVGSQPRYAMPDEIEDVKRAVRYIRYNAKQLKIHPDYIGIQGGSAGGHLSLAVAMADEKIDSTAQDPVNRMSSRVQAAAVLYPPTDCLNWGKTGANMVNMRDLQLFSGVYGAFDFRTLNNATKTYDYITDTSARNKIGKEISPIYFITPDDPPVFIIHGDADLVVPLQQSISFIAKLKESGVPNNFIIKKGAGHNPNDMIPEVNQFLDWFDKYLK